MHYIDKYLIASANGCPLRSGLNTVWQQVLKYDQHKNNGSDNVCNDENIKNDTD